MVQGVDEILCFMFGLCRDNLCFDGFDPIDVDDRASPSQHKGRRVNHGGMDCVVHMSGP